MEVTVPGNVLLTGEYMVTEPGGMGIAAAIERRIHLETEPSDTFELHGNWGGDYLFWTLDHPEKSRLFTCIVDVLEKEYDIRRFPPVRVLVDTRPFFTHGNRKRGFGSSAAVSAGVVFVLQTLITGQVPALSQTFPLALRAHRNFQGGRGSGYDIAASLFGGIGLFTGGGLPDYTPMDSRLFALTLVQGIEPVSTADALARYEEWKHAQPEDFRSFFSRSNACARNMSAACDYDEAVGAFLVAKQLGIELGDAIGVSAHFKPAHPSDGQFLGLSPYKSVGAGNELACVLVRERNLAPFSIASRGLVWKH
ncbi:MAG: hypothetical protein JXB03_11405 [Spirochaetales bacterium]|nr:hypothetical protein [Spirochaetales bacterium]